MKTNYTPITTVEENIQEGTWNSDRVAEEMGNLNNERARLEKAIADLDKHIKQVDLAFFTARRLDFERGGEVFDRVYGRPSLENSLSEMEKSNLELYRDFS